eukprot:jgi/Orpsp1_1/1180974/evm.model.c7180000075306.1
MKFYNLLSILNIITIYVINTVYAFDIKSSLKNKLPKGNSNTAKNENYFMIFVNNGSSKDGNHNKREVEEHINSLIDEITTLIIDNKDTYENLSKLEEFEQRSTLRKRDNQNNESGLAYTISSLNDKTIIYSYLSNTVVNKVEELPSVIACVEDRKVHLKSGEKDIKMDKLDKLNEILNETQWSDVSVRENADVHLSLLSQGKFDGNSTDKYDNNFYYPSSAGKDIDIFIFDSGFNFRHSEFANKDERTVKCAFFVKNGEILPTHDDVCDYNEGETYHGLMVSDVAAGLTHGVANKANIYGIAIEGYYSYDDENPSEYPSEYPYSSEYPSEYSYDFDYHYPTDFPSEDTTEDAEFPSDSVNSELKKISHDNVVYISNVFAGLKYIDDNMLRPYKAVFNFSFGIYFDKLVEEDQYIIAFWRDYIDHMASEGVVFVASAGNETNEVKTDSKTSLYPCAFENVICVGAIDNTGMNVLFENENEVFRLMDYQGENDYSEEINERIIELNIKYEEDEKILNKLYKKKVMNPEYYRIATKSNFGEKVNIYAPGWAVAEYKDRYDEDLEELVFGTSFSSPIVAGVAATVMSEHPEIKFDSKKMIEYLTEIGEKNIIEGIKEGDPNVFVNNGKHSIYQGSDNEEVDFDITDRDEVESDGFIMDEVDDE